MSSRQPAASLAQIISISQSRSKRRSAAVNLMASSNLPRRRRRSSGGTSTVGSARSSGKGKATPAMTETAAARPSTTRSKGGWKGAVVDISDESDDESNLTASSSSTGFKNPLRQAKHDKGIGWCEWCRVPVAEGDEQRHGNDARHIAVVLSHGDAGQTHGWRWCQEQGRQLAEAKAKATASASSSAGGGAPPPKRRRRAKSPPQASGDNLAAAAAAAASAKTMPRCIRRGHSNFVVFVVSCLVDDTVVGGTVPGPAAGNQLKRRLTASSARKSQP